MFVGFDRGFVSSHKRRPS